MNDLTSTFVRQRERLNEVIGVLAKYGFARFVEHGHGIPQVTAAVAGRIGDPTLLQESSGERLRGALTELGTTWIKFGQMLSTRPDLVGADVAAELEKLRADVPPDPPGIAKRLVESELGGSVDALYGSFESEAFASGSVAQVHRATLKDGTAVAVKVMHDGADRKIRSDLELMEALARYLEEQDAEIVRYRPTVLVGEFEQMMRVAIDLGQELSNLQRFQANFADEQDVVIPQPYPDMSGTRVLTMAMVEGARFTDRASIEAVGWDVDVLVRRAVEIYLEMIFRDGLYHADPHPGNFLLPDSEHLAILDFGDVGRVSNTRRRQLESMVIAIGTRNVDALTDVILEMTTPPADMVIEGLNDDVDTWLNRYLMVGVGQIDMAGAIRSATQLMRDHGLVLPADLALLFRVLLLLQGLGRGVGTEVRLTELLTPYVHQMMSLRYDPRHLARQAARVAGKYERLVAEFPEDVQAILAQIRSGKLGVDFRVHDADGRVDQLVDGLIAASSILASAQLLSRDTRPTVAGFSLPGAVAAGVGVITWQRLAAGRSGHPTMVARARRLARMRATS
ncbi:MAG TPA: AarF/UbiB family protein [Solirubrobacteraceae bacterium]|nr:AarF/UbiB family protein [Solirubrobacteraceae bacterium]